MRTSFDNEKNHLNQTRIVQFIFAVAFILTSVYTINSKALQSQTETTIDSHR